MLDLLIITVALVLGIAPASPVPPEPRADAVLILDDLEDLYEPVFFDHRVHADMADMGGGCASCHHHSPESTPYPACRSCHEVSRSRSSLTMPGLKGAYHRQCMACHREWSHRDACTACHLPKVSTATIAGARTGAVANVITAAYRPRLETRRSFVFHTDHETPVVTFHHADHAGTFGLSCADCHQDESCAGCHDSVAAVSTPEPSAVRASCSTCHDRQAQQDCSFCHKTCEQDDLFDHAIAVGWPLEPHHADLECATCHGPADAFTTPSGGCTDCHAGLGVSQINHRTLSPGTDCGDCHEEVAAAMTGSAYRHPPLEDGCTTCHDLDDSDQRFFLRDSMSALCFACHDDVQDCFEHATLVHGPAQGDHGCTTCHAPHGSSQPGLLRQSRDALCLGCHDRPVDAGGGQPLKNVAAQLRAGPNRHGALRDGDCTACHQPHGTASARLLRAPYPTKFYASYSADTYALCFGCHEEQRAWTEQQTSTTGFRNGDANLHWKHVQGAKGRACHVCHDPHASSDPFCIRETVQFDRGLWSFSMGYEQTQDGGRCAPACHEPAEYRRSDLLARAPVPVADVNP
ncbi:MAG: hypothetical protein GY715_16650 [Planctomycetes bacterium]|nr:hypothetical protein [Planctomycetota bacterium]